MKPLLALKQREDLCRRRVYLESVTFLHCGIFRVVLDVWVFVDVVFLRWVVYHHLRQVSWKWRSASFPHQKRRIPIHQFPYSVTSALIVTTSGGMSPFTRDALIITTQEPPPGHVQPCSLDDPGADIWWLLKHVQLASGPYVSTQKMFFSQNIFFIWNQS